MFAKVCIRHRTGLRRARALPLDPPQRPRRRVRGVLQLRHPLPAGRVKRLALAGDGSAATGAFDWGKQGLDTDSMALVNDRQWKGVPDVLTSYRNLEKLIGVPPERVIKLPGDKDPAESWGAVYDRLGRPKAATDYKIPLPEGDTGEFAKAIAPIFHEAGLSQAQVQKIAEKHNALMVEQTKKATEAAKATQERELVELKAEWGADYDKHNDTVDKAAAAFGMTKEHAAALKQAMGPKAAMKFLHAIGSKIAVEGQFVAGDKGGGGGFETMNPQMAEAKIKANMKDRSFMERFNSADPVVRGEARQEMDRLHQQAYPGGVEQ
jgi:hypothetical protein